MRPKVHHYVHNNHTTRPYPEPDESGLQPPALLSTNNFNIILPPMPVPPKWSLTFNFLSKLLSVFPISPMLAVCPTHFTLFDLIILILDEHKSQNSLCDLLISHCSLSLRTKHLLCTLFLLSNYVLHYGEKSNFTFTQNNQNKNFV